MPKVVVTYFGVRGLGEPTRMLLAYGGQEFEDRRVTFEEWPAIKPTTPFGVLPVLEIDGKQYAQSVPIARYLGRKYGLAGADAEEDFIIDQNVEFLMDLKAKAIESGYELNLESRKKKHDENAKNHFPVMLEKLNTIVIENKGHIALDRVQTVIIDAFYNDEDPLVDSSGRKSIQGSTCGATLWIQVEGGINPTLTWADFVFAGVYDALKMYMQTPDLDNQYPAFKKLKDEVRSLPKVKEYVKKTLRLQIFEKLNQLLIGISVNI